MVCLEGSSESLTRGCNPKLNCSKRNYQEEQQVLNGSDRYRLPANGLRLSSGRCSRSRGQRTHRFSNSLRRNEGPELSKQINSEHGDGDERQRYNQQLPKVAQ